MSSGRAMTQPTVQPATSSTSFGRGRGRGQTMNAPMGRGRGQSEAQGSTLQGHHEHQMRHHEHQRSLPRVFAITQDEASRAPEVITSKLYLFDTMIYTLIDSGSTHSFISPA